MTTLTYREAVIQAMADAMQEDGDVFLLGEDVGAAGGAFKMTAGLFERFGPERVIDTPISEQAIIGTAIGAAVMGLRPIAEIMFSDFAAVCFDQIANELAKYRYMTNGQVTAPVTIRLANGANGFAAQHSQACENWFLNVTGLKLLAPGTPRHAYGLLRAAIRDPNPVLYFEHKALFNAKEDVSEPLHIGEIGRAEVVRAGTDLTLVATQLMRHRAVAAAEQLAQQGVSVEVIDPLTLAPLDLETLLESIDKTNHFVVAQEASGFGSWGSSVIAQVVAERFESLDAPPTLVSGDDTPIPYAENLENAWVPSVERIVAAVQSSLRY
jgi:acetoin:2,6-dichlorophenolindophenol oxidoreductase subunit beta